MQIEIQAGQKCDEISGSAVDSRAKKKGRKKPRGSERSGMMLPKKRKERRAARTMGQTGIAKAIKFKMFIS